MPVRTCAGWRGAAGAGQHRPHFGAARMGVWRPGAAVPPGGFCAWQLVALQAGGCAAFYGAWPRVIHQVLWPCATAGGAAFTLSSMLQGVGAFMAAMGGTVGRHGALDTMRVHV